MDQTAVEELSALLTDLEHSRSIPMTADAAQPLVERLVQVRLWLASYVTDELTIVGCKCMDSVLPDNPLYPRALRRLQTLCRYTKCLPASCHLREIITLDNQHPFH